MVPLFHKSFIWGFSGVKNERLRACEELLTFRIGLLGQEPMLAVPHFLMDMHVHKCYDNFILFQCIWRFGMSLRSYSQHKSLLNGEILLYTLADSKNGIWQVRFLNRINDKKRYIRKSTGHRDITMATAIAMDLYRKHQSKLTLGLTEERVTISTLCEEFLNDSTYNKVRKDLVKYHLRVYWIKFFKQTDIGAISSDDIKEYFDWRLDNNHKIKKHGAWQSSEDTTSYSSIQHDKVTLRMVLQLGEQKRRLVKAPIFPRINKRDDRIHKLPSNQSRGRFTAGKNGTYEIVRKDFKEISIALNRKAWMPSLMVDEEDHHPETNPYVSVGHRRSRHFRRFKEFDYDEKAQIYCHKYKRYLRATYWFLGLLISNSGIRVSEAIRLRVKDIQLVEVDGKYYTTINVSEDNSKTGRRRNMITRDGHETYRRFLKYQREVKFRFNKTNIKDNDWLFPSTSRKNEYIKFKSTAEYNDLARQNFKRLGIHTQDINLRNTTAKIYFSFYSFRSWYISSRLRNKMNIYVLSKNIGSSVATIIKYYAYNEMLEFRDEMIAHTNKEYSFSEVGNDIKKLATTWR